MHVCNECVTSSLATCRCVLFLTGSCLAPAWRLSALFRYCHVEDVASLLHLPQSFCQKEENSECVCEGGGGRGRCKAVHVATYTCKLHVNCLSYYTFNKHTWYIHASALPIEQPRQLSWLGPNLTSHSTPDEQANHQLSRVPPEAAH